MRLNNRGNWSLIGMLVAVAIVVSVAAMYFGGNMTTVKEDSPVLDKSSTKQTVVGKAMDTAKGADCRQHLNQIRTGIATYKASQGTEDNPPTLKDLQLGVSADYFQCPVSNQPYKYDPAVGQVQCQYAGHVNF